MTTALFAKLPALKRPRAADRAGQLIRIVYLITKCGPYLLEATDVMMYRGTYLLLSKSCFPTNPRHGS